MARKSFWNRFYEFWPKSTEQNEEVVFFPQPIQFIARFDDMLIES
jgi:hypothetical protein